MLRCPKCMSELTKKEKIYFCKNGHCYDIASQGYVNLMLANQKHSANPGDDIQSLQCRDLFLQKGYYEELAKDINEQLNKYVTENKQILDAGCGTGYYLNYLINNSKYKYNYYATDISKKGVIMTTKKCKEAVCFVSSVFNLPLDDACIDATLSIFCPYSADEFARVIKDDGYLIAVTPGKEHLYQLKEIVYDNPYYNQEDGYNLPEFDLIQQHNVKYMFELTSKEDIASLWKMMPYYHTSSQKDSQKLFEKEKILTTADFLVQVFKRKKV